MTPHKATALIALLLSGTAASLPAHAAESAIVMQILDGKQLYIDQQQAEVKQRASAPQVVSTRQSRGQLSFNTGAAARINRNSVMRLGSSCFLMEKGQILISGKQNGCTRTARLSVRGTNYILKVNDDGSTDITVLEGNVEVEPLKDGKPTGKPPLVLNPGQQARVAATGALSRLLQLSPVDYRDILGGPLFFGFTRSLPGLGALENYLGSFVPGALTSSV
ncbi:MAG: FecR domain-containing protein, partial [Prochlorococcaceae cyanobacterium]